jgi:predicted transcriptional regulator
MIQKKIMQAIRERGPCTQQEISKAVGKINRAVLLGYLRCLCDLGKIKAKKAGKALVYYS